MRFALIFNPFKYKIHEENIKIVQKYFGLFPPLSLAWVAAIAEEANHTTTIIDARTLNLSKEQTLSKLKEFKPDIMGFMMTTYMFPETLEWIKYLKSNLKVPVVVGGYNLRVYPYESLFHSEIDFGVVKHAIKTIPQLFSVLEKGGSFREVEGLIYREDKQVKMNPIDSKPVDFNKFPMPERKSLPNHLYAEFPTQRRNFTVMVTSLGCPKGCKFCEAGRTAYSPRTPKKVADEMEYCYKNYNIREIDIFDYDFTVDKKRVENICNEIINRKLDIIWACRSRIDNVNQNLLKKMKSAGCQRIYFGIESGSQKILNTVNKGISLKQIEKTIDLCNWLNIQTLGFFLIGAPGETRTTVKETLKFAKKLKLDYVQFSKCLAKPQTPLWERLVKTTGKDYWREWVLGKEKDEVLPRPWTELTNSEIDKLTRWSYVSYYCRPSFLFKSIFKVKSFKEFRRKFYALLDMIFQQERKSISDKKFKAYNEN